MTVIIAIHFQLAKSKPSSKLNLFCPWRNSEVKLMIDLMHFFSGENFVQP